jgi:hypothetical protein
MQRVLILFVATVPSMMISMMTLGNRGAAAAGDSRAAVLLAQARAAIGGDKVLAGVRALSCAGTIQRAFGDRQVAGDLSIDLALPDKMLRSESLSPMGDASLLVTEQGLNGDTLLRSVRTLNTPPGALIRTPPPPSPGSDAEAQALRNSRAELARFVVAMLLASPSALPVDFTDAGEAEGPDGKADVLDVKGAGGFAAKLFLDKATHRPLMLSYRGASPRVIVQTQRVQGPPPPAQPNARADAPQPPEIVDITMFFDDYRSVDGVQLPHHVVRAVDGQTNEEWTFKTIKVNPSFKADAFTRR